MRCIYAAIYVAMMLGLVTPQVGVAQAPSVPSAVQLADKRSSDETPSRATPRRPTAPSQSATRSIRSRRSFRSALGRRLEYKVKLGIFNAGEAHMEVLGIDSVRGEPAYHVDVAMRGSHPVRNFEDGQSL